MLALSFLKMTFIRLGKFTYSPYIRGKLFRYEWIFNSFNVFPASIETTIYMVALSFIVYMMNYTDWF